MYTKYIIHIFILSYLRKRNKLNTVTKRDSFTAEVTTLFHQPNYCKLQRALATGGSFGEAALISLLRPVLTVLALSLDGSGSDINSRAFTDPLFFTTLVPNDRAGISRTIGGTGKRCLWSPFPAALRNGGAPLLCVLPKATLGFSTHGLPISSAVDAIKTDVRSVNRPCCIPPDVIFMS